MAGGEAAPAEALGMCSSLPQSYPSLHPAPGTGAQCSVLYHNGDQLPIFSAPNKERAHMAEQARRSGTGRARSLALASGRVVCGEESPQTVRPKDQGVPGRGARVQEAAGTTEP